MAFHLSIRTFAVLVRTFAETEIAPRVGQWNREGMPPIEAVHAMDDLGLFGLGVS